MAAVDWLPTAVDDLLEHDLGRIRREPSLRPIGSALRQLVDAYFGRFEPGHPLPGQAIRQVDDLPVDIRITRVTIGRTGGPYRVFFHYIQHKHLFEFWRIGYPQGNRLRP